MISISATGHSLAVTLGGQIWSWGRNSSSGGGGYGSEPIKDSGQLGWRDPSSTPPGRPAVVITPPGVRFVAVASGRYHSLALDADGGVWSWGLNDYGQLGRSATDSAAEESPCTRGAGCRSGVPALVPGLPKAVRIAATRYASLAVTAEGGRVWTWGADSCGVPLSAVQVSKANGTADVVQGVRAAAHAEAREVAWAGLGDIVQVDGGYAHWAMRDVNSDVWTCDTGGDGYLGSLPSSKDGWQSVNLFSELGRYEEEIFPGRVPALHADAVAAGRCFTLAVRGDGAAVMWGCDIQGIPTRQVKIEPRPVPNTPPALDGRVVEIAAGEYGAAAVISNGSVLVWGVSPIPAPTGATLLPGIPPELSAAHVAGGHQHYLAILVPSGTPALVERNSRPSQAAAHDRTPDPIDVSEAGDLATADVAKDAKGAKASADVSKKSKTAVAEALAVTTEVNQQSSASNATATAAGGVAIVDVSKGKPTLVEDKPTVADQQDSALMRLGPEKVAAARKYLEDVFENRGEPMETNNQCWKDRRDDQPRCIPAFSILGVSKCGTTDLYQKLVHLPGFMGSHNKGPHYWDSNHPSDGWDRYVNLYDKTAALVAQGKPDPLVCDASSATFSYAAVGVRGDRLSGRLPLVLKVAQPLMKVIVMVRNPVDRFYSAFYYYGCSYSKRDVKFTPETFHERAEREVAIFRGCIDSGKRAFECAGETFYLAEQLVKGIYSAVLRNWLDMYTRDEFMLIRTESYAKKARQTILSVHDFLGVEHPPEDLLASELDKRYNEGSHENPNIEGCTGPRLPMLSKTRALLEEFYAPYNEQLALLWGDPEMTWEPKVWKP